MVNQALRFPFGKDGLKAIEGVFGQHRRGEVIDADENMRQMRLFYETGKVTHLRKALGYNKDDVRSLRACHLFLEGVRETQIKKGVAIARPLAPGERDLSDMTPAQINRLEARTAKKQAANERSLELHQLLVAGLPANQAEWTAEDKAKRLLFDLAEWHRREALPDKRDFALRLEMTAAELYEDNGAISGLKYIDNPNPEKVKRSLVHEYSFAADQLQSLSVGDTVVDTTTGRAPAPFMRLNFPPQRRRFETDSFGE